MTAIHSPFLKPAITGWDLSLIVRGTPAGQGRVSFLGKGRAVHSNAKVLKPWRAAIVTAANQAMTRHNLSTIPKGTPVETSITVFVPRPKTTRGAWPVTRFSSDLDHHARAVHDALSEAGVFADDSQVVLTTARKTYPTPLELDEPGAIIHIRVLPEAVA